MRIKLCIIVTDPMNLWSLYKGQLTYLKANGIEITAIASHGEEHKYLEKIGIISKPIFMKRDPSILADIASLIKIIIFLAKNKFDIVSISTPKASFLGAIAAYLTMQKNIVFTLRGRAYENKTGLSRKAYEIIDKIICKISDKVFCISHELRKEFIEKKICESEKIFVIGYGSSNGVDLKRFTITEKLIATSKRIALELDIPKNSNCLLYSGRIRKDKGIEELVLAFISLVELRNDVFLIIQGKPDVVDKVSPKIQEIIKKHPKIYTAPWVHDVEKYFVLADIFVFPSHREGFGNVALEASAMNLPVIGFDVIGTRESVLNGKTGILCKAFEVEELKAAINFLLDNPTIRQEMGKIGRDRVEKEFDSEIIWAEILETYKSLLIKKNTNV